MADFHELGHDVAVAAHHLLHDIESAPARIDLQNKLEAFFFAHRAEIEKDGEQVGADLLAGDKAKAESDGRADLDKIAEEGKQALTPPPAVEDTSGTGTTAAPDSSEPDSSEPGGERIPVTPNTPEVEATALNPDGTLKSETTGDPVEQHDPAVANGVPAEPVEVQGPIAPSDPQPTADQPADAPADPAPSA